MNNRLWILIALAAILMLIVPLSIYSFNEPNQVKEESMKGVIVREASAGGAHYINYIWEDKLFLEDLNTKVSTLLYNVTGTVRPSFTRRAGYVIPSQTYIFGTQIIDPVSLKIGIKKSIPYTYDSTMENNFIYLDSLLYDGWEIQGYYSDYNYIEYYLKKEKTVVRVIILENSIKIYNDIKGELPDPLKFIKAY